MYPNKSSQLHNKFYDFQNCLLFSKILFKNPSYQYVFLKAKYNF